ncbi:NinE family protein [Serratia fonticola]|nr:NinE family protein [Serratia fonticola]MDQ7209031.1 NinE family protein [Serratia fonticola]
MRRQTSPTQLAMNNLIFRVTHKPPRKQKPSPVDIPTFNYTAQLSDSMWLRRRARGTR